jgi:hypothetical protein
MSWRRSGLALAVLVILAMTLASCAVSATKASGVAGIVLFEGGAYMPSPSPLPGGFGSGSKGRPYRFVLVQVMATSGPNAGKVVAKLKPNAQAVFSVDLPPGSYILTPLVPKNGPWPRPTTVTVRAGQRTHAIVSVEGM